MTKLSELNRGWFRVRTYLEGGEVQIRIRSTSRASRGHLLGGWPRFAWGWLGGPTPEHHMTRRTRGRTRRSSACRSRKRLRPRRGRERLGGFGLRLAAAAPALAWNCRAYYGMASAQKQKMIAYRAYRNAWSTYVRNKVGAAYPRSSSTENVGKGG